MSGRMEMALAPQIRPIRMQVLVMVQICTWRSGKTYSDVALHCHAGQIERAVEGGEDGDDQQEAAERDVDGVEGVADDVQKHTNRQLNHVVDNQVDEEDVSRVHLEDLQETEAVQWLGMGHNFRISDSHQFDKKSNRLCNYCLEKI